MPRKASTTITLVALSGLSIAVATACGSTTADCVLRQPNGSYKAVDDKYCPRDGGGGSGSGGAVWLYGGTRASDGRISGGTFSKPANGSISTRSGTTIRGGFGGHGGSGS